MPSIRGYTNCTKCCNTQTKLMGSTLSLVIAKWEESVGDVWLQSEHSQMHRSRTFSFAFVAHRMVIRLKSKHLRVSARFQCNTNMPAQYMSVW